MPPTSTTDRSASIRAAIRAGVILVAGISAALFAWYYAFVQMFSRYAVYDDESYLMLSLQSYLSGHWMYERFHVLYGPFYYLLKKLLFATIPMPVDHDHTRLITLVFWLLSALLCSYVVYAVH